MAREFSEKFYKSAKWKKCREAVIKMRMAVDGGLCQVCRKNPGYIVHHKITLTADNINDPDVSLSFENLEYVCKSCHDEFDGHGLNKSKPACVFDEFGQPISIRTIDRDAGEIYERRR